MATLLSSKRLQINKANATVVLVIALATFVVIFSLVASKQLLDQRSYQSRVISEKKKTLKQLQDNNKAASELVNSYKVFVSNPTNIIGGTSGGTGDRDGDNARIILDALPSKYDFPALATSLDKILTSPDYKVTNISGSDDELNQSQPGQAAQAVEIPFQVGASGSFAKVQNLFDTLQRSIRPIQITTVSLTGNDANLNVSITAKTFYQPSKEITITSKEVK